MAVRYKIPEFKSKPSRMSYAFQHEDVPDVADYLEVLYRSGHYVTQFFSVSFS